MDCERLNMLIDEKGIKKTSIANQLGISYSTLWKRLTGKTVWRAGEVNAISKILGLTGRQTQDIFFD